MMAVPVEILDAFRRQVSLCREAGSDFTARLMASCVTDLEAGGALAELLHDWRGQPFLDALPQRVLGAVQLLMLQGRAPELAKFYPSLGGEPAWPEAGDAFLAVVARNQDLLRPRLDEQVQTNEVRRCASLLGGFLEIASNTPLPLRLLEIGSSAGLNLFWDRYRYQLGAHQWGEASSPVVLDADWRGAAPPLAARPVVSSRLGCDLSPLDATDPAQLRRIESFLWADQIDRHRLLKSAAQSLGGVPAPVERGDAAAFVERELAERSESVATVLFHSMMWWYVSPEDRDRITRCVEQAGARADHAAPLGWLRAEPPHPDYVEVRLRFWPGGDDRLLARAHHHGRWVEWLGDSFRK